ncbi:branched-chain amino acid ABC transporter ATP-binding protein [Candidatus Caldarchaeum subterraneum]|uniref:Branched-chain amino acid ABC transporter ATP-binding protein n=1 Tax=Caldiarchaeum subterraneum TaxID=311458 RepID=E6N804_CALS0|nr:branched-chain amino acid ABC transporter ATP-binding protein [Candidatus Caldarchaeum subterraneum]BAJ51195.1 branched-chain amino acid ABC transporter ATP-binding protein [Candidatus Caldarchaeum subterraneum]
MEKVLEAVGLTAGYGLVTIIEDISVEVREREIVAVIGPNGAGKTTLMLALAGLATVKSGKTLLNNEDITRLPPYERVVKGLVLSLERRRLFPDMTVYENVMTGAYRRRDRENIRKDYEMVAELFPIIEKRRKQLAGTLSGGEQQMVALARALMARPRVLLLDEPSVGLAPIARLAVFEKVREIRERQNIAILVVEQDAALALQTADRAYVMEGGRITLEGSGTNLLSSPKIRESYIGL